MLPPRFGRTLATSALFLLLFTLVLGVVYPFAMWGVGRAFAAKTDGSFVTDDTGTVVGSRLIGQEFPGQDMFHSRPSAAGYDAMDSGATNLTLTDAELIATVDARRLAIMAEEGLQDPAAVPVDAVTASASGLDPHISPDYAALQVPRVARATGVAEEQLLELIGDATEGRGVNVLLLNLAVQRTAATN
ncbi:potassium-transporting ATPase subunit C [Corynebacterium sp. 13CS0277]|uniref:potassium-transporting ATPase subunit C n=1 Tax=Corynebacterium sp. 13CS0277 TaxID=2071994 RepID=UPI000D03CE2A|nr:potassium-transporting ATPase subunit C [Corynebacterium sp. 13CS0277]PRQ11634.1 potassium-transporting ATPase subunit C [Corynebacterium sp. 13CS0277]